MFRCSEVRSSPVRPVCNPVQHKPRPHCRTFSDFHSNIKLSSLSFNFDLDLCQVSPPTPATLTLGELSNLRPSEDSDQPLSDLQNQQALKMSHPKLYTGRDGVNGLIELGQLNLTFMISLKL